MAIAPDSSRRQSSTPFGQPFIIGSPLNIFSFSASFLAAGAFEFGRRGPILLPQQEALDFSGRGFRQFSDEVDPTRIFVRGKAALAELASARRLSGGASVVARSFRMTKASGLIRPSCIERGRRRRPRRTSRVLDQALDSISNGEHQMPPTFNMSSLRPL